MYKLGLHHYPFEFGGILVGVYSKDLKSCTITEVIPALKFQNSPTLFERGTDGIIESLTKLYIQNPAARYVGEWHTHPNGVPHPSAIDIKTMHTIAEDVNVKITSPMLIILGLDKNNYSVGIYIHIHKKLFKYE